MAYEKPHKNLNEQIAIMERRGMDTGDQADAVAILKRIGYYRLSAYSYPLRQWVTVGGTAERSDQFIEGTTLDQVAKLHDFDRKLRTHILDGLGQVEVGLRYAVSYTLGKRDSFGHLNVDSLDLRECSKLQNRRSDKELTRFAHWSDRFERRIRESENEDFVRHFADKYEGRMPIWVAAEVLDFGSLVRLYSFLRNDDKKLVARAIGLNGVNTTLLHTNLMQLNTLRNHCAHQSRIWNRNLVFRAPASNLGSLPDRLGHLAMISPEDSNKIYLSCAMVAHIVRHMDKGTNWHRGIITLVNKMPEVPGRATPETMGFPSEWRSEELWK